MNIVDWNGMPVDLDHPFREMGVEPPLSDDPVERQLQLLHRENLARAQAALTRQFENGQWWTGGIRAFARSARESEGRLR